MCPTYYFLLYLLGVHIPCAPNNTTFLIYYTRANIIYGMWGAPHIIYYIIPWLVFEARGIRGCAPYIILSLS
jgi:hypothetical protein